MFPIVLLIQEQFKENVPNVNQDFLRVQLLRFV